MRRARDATAADPLGRRPHSCPGGSVAARCPFVRVSVPSPASVRGSASARRPRPSTASKKIPSSPPASPTSTSTSVSSAAPDVSARDEDELLRALAAAGRARVLAAHALAQEAPAWRPRRTSAAGEVLERRADSGELQVLATATLPCSAAELSAALAGDGRDELNATLLALLGGAFAFAVALRAVPATPAAADPGASPHRRLSTKLVQLHSGWGPLRRARSLELLDCEDEAESEDAGDASSRRIRVVRALRRDPADGRLAGAGDLLLGLELREKRATQSTRVRFFGAARAPSNARALRRLAAFVPKLAAIAERRRLGAHYSPAAADSIAVDDTASEDDAAMDSARSLALGADASACAACSAPLGRRRRACALCGLGVCGRCAPAREVEERLGVVHRRRVCGECVTTLRREAFAPPSPSPSPSPSVAGCAPSCAERRWAVSMCC